MTKSIKINYIYSSNITQLGILAKLYEYSSNEFFMKENSQKINRRRRGCGAVKPR